MTRLILISGNGETRDVEFHVVLKQTLDRAYRYQMIHSSSWVALRDFQGTTNLGILAILLCVLVVNVDARRR